jgi:uncharacterized membrane protein YeaQ/YmgE (transglycosylase-associated protein family)
VFTAGAVGTFFIGNAGTMVMDWLTKVFVNSDNMTHNIYMFMEEVIGSLWGGAGNFE